MSKQWTSDDVKARLKEAVRTMRSLRVEGLKPAGYRGWWPDIVHDEHEAYGWEPAAYKPDPPTPNEITKMDETLGWLRWLDKDHVTVLWMHAEGADRTDIQINVGVTRTKLWQMWKSGLEAIVYKLNGSKGKNCATQASRTKPVEIVKRQNERRNNSCERI